MFRKSQGEEQEGQRAPSKCGPRSGGPIENGNERTEKEDRFALLSWYKVRDTLLGENMVQQDVQKALKLASSCEHAEAIWLVRLFSGHDGPMTRMEARDVFRTHEKEDTVAGCFAALMSNFTTGDRVRQAADAGYGFAQAHMAESTSNHERFKWAVKAAAQGERGGFFWLGSCYECGRGCEKDESKAKDNYLVAAQSGEVSAMLNLGLMLDITNPLRYSWLGKAGAGGDDACFLVEMAQRMSAPVLGQRDIIFAIGKVLKGHVNVEKEEIYGENDARFLLADQAIQFFELQLLWYRRAVDAWSIVGRRFGVVKDVRILIAKIIWNARDEASY